MSCYYCNDHIPGEGQLWWIDHMASPDLDEVIPLPVRGVLRRRVLLCASCDQAETSLVQICRIISVELRDSP